MMIAKSISNRKEAVAYIEALWQQRAGQTEKKKNETP